MGRLEGKKAIITGAASGIGLATAGRFLAEGARVVVLDVAEQAGEAAARDLGCEFVHADVTDARAMEAAVHESAERLGGLTTLVNNAGEGTLKPLHLYGVDEFDRLVRVNLHGVFNGLRAALPLMLESGGGVIVNNASCSALRAPSGEGPYAAAKAGVLSLTRSTALEYGPTIRSNAISTGMIRTPLNQSLEDQPGLMDDALAMNPLGRHGEMDEVASAIVFLASDEAAYVNGHNLVLDGGAGLAQAGMESSIRKILAMMHPA